MAMTITVAGQTVTFLDPIAGLQYVANISANAYYLMPGYAQDKQYAIETVASPAIDGQVVKRHGFKERSIEGIEIVYINNSAANCLASYQSDHDILKNGPASVVIPGETTYPACEVVTFKKRGRPKDTGASTYRLHCYLEIKQLRLT